VFKSLRPYARAIAPLITTVQILQMAVGTAVTVRSAQLHYQGLRCAAGAYTRPLFSPQGGVNIHYSGERMMRMEAEHAYLWSGVVSRGLHSSTFRLNVSTFCGMRGVHNFPPVYWSGGQAEV